MTTSKLLSPIIVIGLAFFALFNQQNAQAEFNPLPFSVSIDEQKAEKGKNSTHAVIKKPVKADSKLTVDSSAAMIIVNIFPCDEKGTAKQGAAPAIIMLKQTKESKLSKTMDSKKLSPGYHLMNIVADGKTARVLFQVK